MKITATKTYKFSVSTGQDTAALPYEPMAYRQHRHADGSWKGW